MNGRILVDTNVLVELLNGNKRIAEYINDYEICISAISEIELLSNPRLTKHELGIVKDLIAHCTVFDTLNSKIKELSSDYRRKRKIRKTPDAIIVATANYYKLSLFTMDSDFESIEDIDIIFIQ